MPRTSRNLDRPCKWSSVPESPAARRQRLDERRERQRNPLPDYVVETPDARRERRLQEKAYRMAGATMRHRRFFLKVGKTYDRKGKR